MTLEWMSLKFTRNRVPPLISGNCNTSDISRELINIPQCKKKFTKIGLDFFTSSFRQSEDVIKKKKVKGFDPL